MNIKKGESMNFLCPISSCRSENDSTASNCIRCGTPLQGYLHLQDHPAHLFNQGLSRAKQGEFEQARDLFAAVVYWCPKDLEARNALALACLVLPDLLEARRQCEHVLAIAPTDPVAQQGLAQLQRPPSPVFPISRQKHAGGIRPLLTRLFSRRKET